MTILRAIGLCLVTASVVRAQATDRSRGTIVGTVSDTLLRPLIGADVSVAGTDLRIATDSLGRFRILRIPPGRFTLIVRSIGHRPAANAIDVDVGDTLRLSFTLEPATAQELATVVITERTLSKKLQDFEERRKQGLGEFFTRADIETINPLHMGDVLRRAKAVRLNSAGTAAFSAREPMSGLRPPCPMAIYLDGIPLGAERLDYLPPPSTIAAVEVYAGSATLPIWLPRGPLGTKVGCGAILVWTRDGSDG